MVFIKSKSKINEITEIENNGKENVYTKFILSEKGSNKTQEIHTKDQSSKKSFSNLIQKIFLPENYPNSVSDDYLTYQFWDSIQAIFSTLNGILATRAVLEGIGVGKENSQVSSAVLNWIIKDGIGMISRVLFTFIKSRDLDEKPKMWRIIADILNDLAMFIELLIPFFPSNFFLFLVIFSSVCRSIVGVAGVATRTAITEHQAKMNNIADVSSKDGSQETFINLLGLLLGIFMTKLMSDDQRVIWILFIIFTTLHLFSNYKAVSCLKFESLNRQRAFILIQEFQKSKKIFSLKETNEKESIFWFSKISFKIHNIEMGASLKSISETKKIIHQRNNWFFSEDSKGIKFFFLKETTNQEILEAFYFACCRILDKNFQFNPVDFQIFLKGISEQGWDINTLLFKCSYRFLEIK